MEMHHLLIVSVFLSSLLYDGDAGITSSFIRSEWPAVDIPLDHHVFKVPKGYNAPQQVSDLFRYSWFFFLSMFHNKNLRFNY